MSYKIVVGFPLRFSMRNRTILLPLPRLLVEWSAAALKVQPSPTLILFDFLRLIRP